MKITTTPPKNILQIDDEEVRNTLADFMTTTLFAVNGNLEFSNMKVNFVDVLFVIANRDTDVRHNLERKPQGYIMISRSVPLTIYNGQNDWNEKSLFLKATAQGTARLIVF
jgi:hypothetical protein